MPSSGELQDVADSSRTTANKIIEVLPRGSRLLLFTDGLIQARALDGDGSLFEYYGLHEKITEAGHIPCGQFIDALYGRLVEG